MQQQAVDQRVRNSRHICRPQAHRRLRTPGGIYLQNFTLRSSGAQTAAHFATAPALSALFNSLRLNPRPSTALGFNKG